ncbi:endothelin-converting enzyme 1-like isoform X2 [Ornithodoros turicata]|uniref:endothelin-converting enzyme 1-like isoform X2 n=1 Tax=Ornithodoros turicata TaxID=34597 RepID=UPI00313906D8
MASKEKAYKEPTGPSAEPLQRPPRGTPKEIKFTFRKAPKRYTAALVIMGVVIFVLLLTIVLLAVLLSPDTQREEKVLVLNPDGLAYEVGHLALACNDFHKFACSKSPRKSCTVAGLFGTGEDLIQENVVRQLAAALKNIDKRSKVSVFYDTCMNSGGGSVGALLNASKLNRYLDESRDVFYPDPDTNLPVFNYVMANLSVDIFMRFRIETNASNGKGIWVDPAGFAFPSYEYYMDSAPKHYKELVQAYKDFIEKVADLMRDERPSHQTSNIADYVASYERRLLERLDTPGNNTVMFERRTVYNLTHILPVIKWQRLLEAYFPSTPISMEMPIYLTHPHYFDELGKIISTTDTHTLNHYVIWRMVMKYAPHLDKPIRSLYYKFMQKLHGAEDVNLPEEEWWEQCVRHTSHYLGHAVGELYVNQYKDKEKVLEKAKEIAKNVKRASEKTLSHVDWIQDKRQVKEKIGDVDVELGYSNIITDSRYLEEYYKDFIVKLGSHLENVFEGERFLRMKEAEELSQAPGTSIDQVWTTYPQNAVAQYIYERNSVLVPLAVLQKPTFSLSQLKSIQYGSLGSLIATHIFKALDKKGLDMGPQLMEDSTRRIYTEKLQCLAESYPDATVNGEKIDGSRTSGEAFADIAGVKSAFLAFKEAEESTGALPALDLSPEQLFFVGYAQSMCENIRDDRVINANATSTSAPNRLRVLLTVQQLPEFSTAFGCAYDSQVQTAKKCNVW